jgi:amino acid transporter
MKFEWKVTLGASIFLFIVFFAYLFSSVEMLGSMSLLFGATAYLMLCGFFFLQWRRRRRIPRPEDREDGTFEQGAGEVAFFPSASIWPVSMGIGFVFMAVGLVYGIWYVVIGFFVFVGAIIGFSVEAESK